jgi:hypothetical protein
MSFRFARAAAIVFGLIATTAAQAATQCPSTLTYRNGRYLKYGDTFYFPDGSYARYGASVYYPNGRFLRYGSTLYYPNGNYLRYGSTLYFPNGRYLRSGSSDYYANGNYMKYGTSFYYPNGRYARYGGTLFREDGTRTDFPVTVKEPVDPYGFFSYKVRTTSETWNFELAKLVDATQVRVRVSDWPSGLGITMRLNTGYPDENVYVRMGDNGNVTCELESRRPPR